MDHYLHFRLFGCKHEGKSVVRKYWNYEIENHKKTDEN